MTRTTHSYISGLESDDDAYMVEVEWVGEHVRFASDYYDPPHDEWYPFMVTVEDMDGEEVCSFEWDEPRTGDATEDLIRSKIEAEEITPND